MEYNPEWTRNRVSMIIDVFGVDFFKGKTILDIGAAYGDNGGAFWKLGAKVTCVEARIECCNVISEKFPGINVKQGDLDEEQWKYGDFDIIIHWGLLYHLKNPKQSVRTALKHCKWLFLETIVLDTDKNDVLLVSEHLSDHAYNGVGSRPSAKAVECWLSDEGLRNIGDCANFQEIEEACFSRYDLERLNSGGHVYDWKLQNTGKDWIGTIYHSLSTRRFWIAKTLFC